MILSITKQNWKQKFIIFNYNLFLGLQLLSQHFLDAVPIPEKPIKKRKSPINEVKISNLIQLKQNITKPVTVKNSLWKLHLDLKLILM